LVFIVIEYCQISQIKKYIPIDSDVPIVADIQLAIVGDAMMLLIDSGFHNRKSLTSAKNNLVRVNSIQMHPKWQANALIVIRNFRMHN
jgi:hypothetical protein